MPRSLILLGWLGLCIAAPGPASADWPTVALTYPPANASFSPAVTPSIPLQASANDPDESIFAVAFYACPGTGSTCTGGTIPIGTLTSSPYQLAWALPTVATTTSYLIWVEAQNTLGQSRLSAMTPVTVIQSQNLPTVSLIAPRMPFWFVAPAAPVLYATATPGNTAPPSTIAQLDFLADGAVIATLTTPNSVPSGYAAVWANAVVGPHWISARATDSLGNSVTSAALAIYVDAPDPLPGVILTAPTTGQTFTSSSTVALSATVTSTQAPIQRLEFLHGNMILATLFGPPYTASWVSPPPGNYAIVARAVDDFDQATTSAAAYIQVLAGSRAPAVVMTAPAPGSTVPAGVPLPLAATALAPDGNIGRVDFYVGATLVASAATSPYTSTWPNPQVGAQSLTAKAYDLKGVDTTSAAVAVTVSSSLVPTVTLTSPTSGASFNAPATITVTATPAEPGGSISKVDFYANGNSIGTKTTAPYTIPWSSVAVGSYTLSAKVTDSVGTTGTSAGIPITVIPPVPTVALSAPIGGTRYTQGQAILVTAQATTPGSTITSLEFDSDGAAIGTLPVSGNISAGTYTFTWNGALPGAHLLSAKVFAASGATTTSAAVGVTVSDLAVSLSEPVAGQVYQASTPVQITAGVTDTGGAISRVDFYTDGVLRGSSTGAPYRVVWNNPASGTHTLTATAFDASGLSAASAAVLISVLAAPTLQVDAGIDGSTVGDDNTVISGIVQAPINAAVMINGQPAVLNPNGSFFVDNLTLQQGANTLTLTLNTADVAPITRTITVTSTGTAPFQVTLDRQEGLAPLTVNLTLRNRGGVPFKRIEIDTTDNGTADVVLTGLPSPGQSVALTYATPGTYTIRTKVYDANDNVIYTAVRRVRAVDPAEVGYKVASVYTTIVNRLTTSDSNGALNGFTWNSRAKYSAVFSALGASLPTIAPKLGSMVGVVVFDDFAELALVRSPADGSQSFLVQLIRGDDGIWRVENM